MADLSITRISEPRLIGDAWLATLDLESDGKTEMLDVSVSGTQACIAGQAPPTADWIRARVQASASARLSNYEPVLEQVRAWPQPFLLFAEPR